MEEIKIMNPSYWAYGGFYAFCFIVVIIIFCFVVLIKTIIEVLWFENRKK